MGGRHTNFFKYGTVCSANTPVEVVDTHIVNNYSFMVVCEFLIILADDSFVCSVLAPRCY